jgi:hypothetical protein
MTTEAKDLPPQNKDEAWEWLLDKVDRLSREVKELRLEVNR